MPHVSEIEPRLVAALSCARSRPLALEGASGTGKTTALRRVARRAGADVVWRTAFDLTEQMIGAIRDGSDDVFRAALVGDERPLCVEHLEDVRDKLRTQVELSRVLGEASRRRPVVLTLTRGRGHDELVRWLLSWTELVSVD